MCGKIQHTTTFVSVYLLILFIVSDFVEQTRGFDRVIMGVRDDTRMILRDFPTRDFDTYTFICTFGRGFFS